ncbi:Otopetrin-3, partial [Armadillidium vulgare]
MVLFHLNQFIPCPTMPNPAFCDDTLFTDPAAYGQCSPIPASTTDCGCSSTTTCIADPNNASVVLHCESSPATSDTPCSVPAIDLDACSCLTCSDTCPLVDDPNDDCSMYYLCYQGNLLPDNCSAPYCFNQAECQCLEPISTTISSTGYSTTDLSTLGSSTIAKSSTIGTSPSVTAASGTSPSVTAASGTSPSVTVASGTSPSVTAARQ